MRRCSTCGVYRRDLRAGITFSEVRAELWAEVCDPDHWRVRIVRSTVLGRMHEVKEQTWLAHIHGCEMAPSDDDTEPAPRIDPHIDPCPYDQY